MTMASAAPTCIGSAQQVLGHIDAALDTELQDLGW